MTIQLTINPCVIDALTKAFPNSNAKRALDKYVATLEQLLSESVRIGQTPEQHKLNLYSISTKKLRDTGGQIGPNKTWLHKWLSDNNLALVKQVIAGSNLSGQLSQVKLTSLTTIKDTLLTNKNDKEKWIDDRTIDLYLTGDEKANEELFNQLYPNAQDFESTEQLQQEYDISPVDTESLKGYIYWLTHKASGITQANKEAHIRQARLILAVAQYTDGYFLQRKKPSAFGRTYYYGLSIQNINKTMRRSVLGNCWEYDIRSSVITWKMGFAKEYVVQNDIADLRKQFAATIAYLEDKADFTNTVRYLTFGDDSTLSKEAQAKLVKQALTAVSFGARDSNKGWLRLDGNWQNPAIVEIIKNKDERKRFLSNSVVRAFIHEQKLLDDYIYSQVIKTAPELLTDKALQTQSGRPSKSKVIAYLYQHAETNVMDLVCSIAKSCGHKPIARIHDAVIFKRRLGVDLKHEIELQMRETTGNPYWHLSAKELERFASINVDAIAFENEHRAHIAREEAVAKS